MLNDKEVWFDIQISGCPTACMHCYANGGYKSYMPFEDSKWVFDNAVDYFEKNNIKFSPNLFHEMYAHPDIAKIQPMVNKLGREILFYLANILTIANLYNLRTNKFIVS